MFSCFGLASATFGRIRLLLCLWQFMKCVFNCSQIKTCTRKLENKGTQHHYPSKKKVCTNRHSSVGLIGNLSRMSICSKSTVSTVHCLQAPGGAEQALLSKKPELKLQIVIYFIRQMRCVSPTALLTESPPFTVSLCVHVHIQKKRHVFFTFWMKLY